MIGREIEQDIFKRCLYSKKAEFVAIYGRRRVGKTFLVREYFSKNAHCAYFEVSGVKDGKMHQQLEIFARSLSSTFYNDIPIKIPQNWDEAFNYLTVEIKKIINKPVIVFLDELPWLATKRSNLIQYLDYYWNSHWSKIKNLKIIVCGSAAAWILNNLINAKGGLYNRLTRTVLLQPFNLRETKLFLESKGLHLTHKQILDVYMVFGGIPFYLDQIQPDQSIAQNINAICFAENGILMHEFSRLFKSLFENAVISLKIIKALATKRSGVSREELLSKIKVKSGGWINERIEELEAAGFVASFTPYRKKNEVFYRIIDEFSWFCLKWIVPEIAKGYGFDKSHWFNVAKSSEFLSWAGYAFENVCFKHLDQIRKALNLENIKCIAGSWRLTIKKGEKKDGTQIDLLFDRDDNAITICEIKYVDKNKFRIDKAYAKNLDNKIEVFKQTTDTKKQVFLALITTYGLETNLYAEDLVHREVVLDALFA